MKSILMIGRLQKIAVLASVLFSISLALAPGAFAIRVQPDDPGPGGSGSSSSSSGSGSNFGGTGSPCATNETLDSSGNCVPATSSTSGSSSTSSTGSTSSSGSSPACTGGKVTNSQGDCKCPDGTTDDGAGNCEDAAIKCTNNKCDLVKLYVDPAINVLSAIAGVVFVISLVLASITYITAGADPQKVSAAKRRIINTIIALFAFLFLYAFLQFLVPGGIFNKPTIGGG